METLAQLIRRLGLEERTEYVIVPFVGHDGKPRRAYFLKRSYLRIVYPDHHAEIFPLTHLLEATVRRPDEPISRAIELYYDETGIQRHRLSDHPDQEPLTSGTEQVSEEP